MKTATQEGYKFIKYIGKQVAVFQEIETGNQEVFVANKFHHGWGFSWNNTDWESLSDYKPKNSEA